MKSLFLLIACLAIFGNAHAKTFQFSNSLPAQYYVPCNEFHRNCYPGLERCFDHQQCFLKTWIILVALLIPALVILMCLCVGYFFLKQRKIWLRCLLVSLAFAVAGLIIGSIIIGINTEDQEVPFLESEGIISTDNTTAKFDFYELANSETDQSSLKFTRGNVGFATAMGYSALFINITIVNVGVGSFAFYMYRINLEKFEILE
jgi:hypothetical protein